MTNFITLNTKPLHSLRAALAYEYERYLSKGNSSII